MEAQQSKFLDSIHNIFQNKINVEDSTFINLLQEIKTSKDSFDVTSALNYFTQNQDRLSSTSIIELTNARLALDKSANPSQIWKKTIEALSTKLPLDTVNLAFANNSLGEYLVKQKKDKEAIRQFIHTISLYPENSDELELGYSYNNLGVLLGRQGDEGSALPYKKRAFEIFLIHLGEDHPYIGTLCNNIGMSFQKLGNPVEESYYLQKALLSHKKHYPPCSHQLYTINNNLGLSYRNSKEYAKAEEHIQIALDCIGVENIKSDPRYVSLLNVLASIKASDRDRNQREEIEKNYIDCIAIAEKELGKYHPSISGLYNDFGVFLTEEKKARQSITNFESFIYAKFPDAIGKNYLNYLTIDSIRDDYQFLTILSNLGSAKFNLYKQERNALLLEESRSIFELFDQLASSLRPEIINSSSRLALKRFSKRGYVLHNRTLVECYYLNPSTNLLDEIFQNTEKIKNWELLENYAFSKRSNEIASTALAIEIDSLKNAMGIATGSELKAKTDANLTFLIDKLKQKYPEYYKRLYGVQVRSLREVQEFCSKKKQDWIVYFYKSDGQFSSMLINKDTVLLSDTPITNQMLDDNKHFILASLSNKDWNFVEPAIVLYDTLIAPFEKSFTSENLVILPHTSLLNLPFSILINKNNVNDEKQFDYPYLVKNFNISYHYSASLAIETDVINLSFSRPLFIAPSYENQPLNHNIKEVHQAQQKIGGKKIVDNDVSKQLFLDYFGRNDHLHFAGHIASNSSIDSTYLLLSKGIDSLFLTEITDLQTDSRLVVLSGCESALGEANPEAVISPAYAFTFAGSPNIIASLWENNDESSSNLFSYFYKYLQEGRSSIEALRMAKVTYLEKAVKPERHPIYWAPFVYYGQEVHWERKINHKYLLAMAILGIALLRFVFWKRRTNLAA